MKGVISLKRRAAIIYILILLILMTSCTKKSEDTNTSISGSESDIAETIKTSSVQTQPIPSNPIELTNDELINSGGVSADFETDYRKDFINWYCGNYMQEQGEIEKYDRLIEIHYSQFKDVTLTGSLNRILFNNGSTHDISIFTASPLNNDNKKVYLVNAYVADNGNIDFLYNNWDKLVNHKAVGNFFKGMEEYPVPKLSYGMNLADIRDIIGSNEVIYCYKFNEEAVVIISGERKYIYSPEDDNYRSCFSSLQADIINPASLKKLGKTIKLNDLESAGYVITGLSYDYRIIPEEGKLLFDFGIDSMDFAHDKRVQVLYTLNISSDYSGTCEYELRDFTQPSFPYIPLVSESGRYFTCYIDNDLYITDNETGETILVFDNKPDVETPQTDISEYIHASPAFFHGDTLYMNFTGYEGSYGYSKFDPSVREINIKGNGFRVNKRIGDYIYGNTGIYDSEMYYGRFNINDPDNIEKLMEGENLIDTIIAYSDDGKYIAAFYFSSYNDNTEHTVTVYDPITFKKQFVFTIDTIMGISTYPHLFILGDYIFMGTFNNHVVTANINSAIK